MDIFKKIIAAKNAGIPAVLATVVEVSGSAPGSACNKMLIMADKSIAGTIGGGAIEKKIIDEAITLLHAAEPKLLHYELESLGMACGGAMTVFLEPLKHAPELIIFGAGHIGSALSKIGKLLDFTVTVVDNRPEFADKEKLPRADRVIAQDYPEALQTLNFSDNTCLVIVTHRHTHDFEILAHCVGQPFRYLGMIGSRNKVGSAFQQLRDIGVDEKIIEKIHAPVGINIGARSPAEIAIAIAAEIVAEKTGTARLS